MCKDPVTITVAWWIFTGKTQSFQKEFMRSGIWHEGERFRNRFKLVTLIRCNGQQRVGLKGILCLFLEYCSIYYKFFKAHYDFVFLFMCNSKPQRSYDPIDSRWTKSSPGQHFSCSRSHFTRIYVTKGKKRISHFRFIPTLKCKPFQFCNVSIFLSETGEK